ncbi:acetyl-CoA C-acetyltransferase [Bordetella petrii]|uniref:FadA9 protein n=1 Tax=Bordetella petrii (strain ATCC BAA-461 / DSM 12804 / CCUG 43448 / CIP 107267 / Se-1111R) TaxID=340100 RepID=A9IA04_BORPD|nr:acetyl-CoA C-acetyltransferase [Bordetella petrii]CAP44529.1 fadA9 [Bordetella petrii]
MEVIISAARRTPVGSFMGALATVPAHRLGQIAIEAALADAGVDADAVSEVIMGQVLTAAQGQNPARQASIAAGIPKEVPAWGVNQVCGSGLRAIALAAQAIGGGHAEVIVAGGQESMSLAPHARSLRAPLKMGDVAFLDTMALDGLTDAFGGYPMGITAENIAQAQGIDRARQDAYATLSQHRANLAQREGRFESEIVPVVIEGRKGKTYFAHDEYIKSDATPERLSSLQPAFRKNGTVTAGNASGINDGAAALVLMSGNQARARQAPVLARIVSWASAGVDPALMGLGPIPATHAALKKAGWSVADLDLVEATEAFAVQALAVADALGLDPEKTNVNGGAIAIGHPIGASGARILTTLLHEMQRRDVRRGLATLCIGGGMGISLCVER